MWNRIVLLGWPAIAVCIAVPVLKSLDPPPSLTVAVFAIIATIGGGLIGAYLDVPEEWLKTEDERDGQRLER